MEDSEQKYRNMLPDMDDYKTKNEEEAKKSELI
jgi:hypothetical protein